MSPWAPKRTAAALPRRVSRDSLATGVDLGCVCGLAAEHADDGYSHSNCQVPFAQKPRKRDVPVAGSGCNESTPGATGTCVESGPELIAGLSRGGCKAIHPSQPRRRPHQPPRLPESWPRPPPLLSDFGKQLSRIELSQDGR